MKKLLVGLISTISVAAFSGVPQLGAFQGVDSDGGCAVTISKVEDGKNNVEIYEAVTSYGTEVAFPLNRSYVIDSSGEIIYTNNFTGESHPLKSKDSAHYMKLTVDENGYPVNFSYSQTGYRTNWLQPLGAPDKVREFDGKCEFF